MYQRPSQQRWVITLKQEEPTFLQKSHQKPKNLAKKTICRRRRQLSCDGRRFTIDGRHRHSQQLVEATTHDWVSVQALPDDNAQLWRGVQTAISASSGSRRRRCRRQATRRLAANCCEQRREGGCCRRLGRRKKKKKRNDFSPFYLVGHALQEPSNK